MRNSKYRFLLLKILAFVMLILIVVRLFSMQIIDGEVYVKTATSRVSTNTVTKAPRGDILDRYGNVLVTNKSGYSLRLYKRSTDDAVINNAIDAVLDILEDTDDTPVNTLPISMESPYKFEFEDKTITEKPLTRKRLGLKTINIQTNTSTRL